MTTVWERFKFAVATDIDSLVTKKEEKNPIASLNQYIAEAERQTNATGKWLERESQLQLAKASEESDLPDFAEMEVTAYSARVSELKATIVENLTELNTLEQRYEEMKHKVKDMKVKQLQLMGKENATRAHHQMDKVFSPELVAERIGSFDDMASYIETLGAKVEQQQERSVMERRLETLEKNSAKQQDSV